MTDTILEQLTDVDDPVLWALALETVLSDVDARPGTLVEIGRCSHWLAPHKARWIADGEFAWPSGYGSGGHGYFGGLPQFDWSVTLRWTDESWEAIPKRSRRYAVHVSIPSRTRHHRQAAVHTLWMTGKEKVRRFYGFRNRDGDWRCTAVSSFPASA